METQADTPVSEEMDIIQEDYFLVDGVGEFIFPDGVSKIDFKMLTEGERKKYQKTMNRSVMIEKRSGNAVMDLDASAEKHALLSVALTGWNLMRGGTAVPFNASNLRLFLENTSPKLVDELDSAVRKLNDWLRDNLTVEDIDAEIEELEELRKEVMLREAGNAA